VAPPGTGSVDAVQIDPFHVSAIGTREAPFVADPTATQDVELEHETPPSEGLVSPPGADTLCKAQETPFHTSAKADVWLAASTHQPTASHAVGVHEMSLSDVPVDPKGTGTFSSDQLVPFHRSASGDSTAELFV
jgi:hypothetical protein